MLQLLAFARLVHAGNPLVPNVGMADPHLRVGARGGGENESSTFWIFATHDFSANNTGFEMKDWWVWTSPDFVNWTKVSEVPAQPVFNWSTARQADECWATDAIHRDGSWFWYLSVGPSAIGVLSAPTPAGPWHDPIGQPLLDDKVASKLDPKTEFRDPGVLFDASTGEYFLIAGVFNYYMAKLSSDMTSLAEPLRLVQVNPGNHSAWGPYGRKTDDKPYLHERNGLYYLSWGCFYGISNSPYGPYDYRGTVLDTSLIDKAFRMPQDPSAPWYSQQDYADRHGSFAEAGGQWFYVFNDRSHSTALKPGDAAFFRDSVAGYVHYFANGSIAPVVVNARGVGSYDASRGAAIQAENYFRRSRAAVKRELPTSAAEPPQNLFAVDALDGASLFFPRVSGITAGAMLRLRLFAPSGAAVSGDAMATLLVNGQVAGACNLTAKGSNDAENFPLPVEQSCGPPLHVDEDPWRGGVDVELHFQGAALTLGRLALDFFRFT